MLSDEDIECFHENGAVCLRNVFSQEWIQKIERGIEINRREPSPCGENLRGRDGFYFNDYCNWEKIEEFRDFAFNSPAAEIAGKLMKSQYSVFYHEHVLVKDAGADKETPWHHDQAYYPVDGEKNCSIWIPIDPVPKETTLRFVKGSHKLGKWFYPRKFETSYNYPIDNSNYKGHRYEDVPDIDHAPQKYEILEWALQPGDCVVFHMKTLHGAKGNNLPTSRRVLSTRWLGDDTVLAERPWQVSPPYTGGLKTGDRIECATFPKIWEKPM